MKISSSESQFLYSNKGSGMVLMGINPYQEKAKRNGWTPELRAAYLWDYAQRSNTPFRDVISNELSERKGEPSHPMYDYYENKGFSVSAVLNEFNSYISNGSPNTGGNGNGLPSFGISGDNKNLWLLGGAVVAVGFILFSRRK